MTAPKSGFSGSFVAAVRSRVGPAGACAVSGCTRRSTRSGDVAGGSGAGGVGRATAGGATAGVVASRGEAARTSVVKAFERGPAAAGLFAAAAAGGAGDARGRDADGPEASRAQPTTVAIDAASVPPPTIAAFRFHRIAGAPAPSLREFRMLWSEGRSGGALERASATTESTETGTGRRRRRIGGGVSVRRFASGGSRVSPWHGGRPPG